MEEKYIEVLTQSPLFDHLTQKQISDFITNASPYVSSFSKHSFIAMAGDPMEGIGVILEGRAHLTRENVLGQRTIVTDLTVAQMFGEALLFTTHPLWPATIQTVAPTKVLFLPARAFTKLVPGCEPYQTQLLLNLLKDLSEKALVLTRKVHYLTLKGMRDKIFAYLINLYKMQSTNPVSLPHNRQEMADILNVSRTALSRELSRLHSEKILDVSGKTITILDINQITNYEF